MSIGDVDDTESSDYFAVALLGPAAKDRIAFDPADILREPAAAPAQFE
jgi:hypothetical protein